MRTSRTALFVRSTGIEAAVVAPTAGYARPKCMPMDEPGLWASGASCSTELRVFAKKSRGQFLTLVGPPATHLRAWSNRLPDPIFTLCFRHHASGMTLSTREFPPLQVSRQRHASFLRAG